VANREALAGDLLEQYQQGRSTAWYWRQVLVAIRWWKHVLVFFAYLGIASWLSTHAFREMPWGQPLDVIFVTLALCISVYLPVFVSAKRRTILALLIIAACFTPAYTYLGGLPSHYTTVVGLVLARLIGPDRSRSDGGDVPSH
jgi:hypothetical protein